MRLGKAKLFYIIFFVLIVVNAIPLSALTIYKISLERDQFREDIIDTYIYSITTVARNLRLFFDARFLEAEYIISRLKEPSSLDINERADIFSGPLSQFSTAYSLLRILGEDGKVVFAYEPGHGVRSEENILSLPQDFSAEKIFSAGKPVISDLYINPAIGSPAFDIFAPFSDSQGKKRILALTLDPRTLLWAVDVPSKVQDSEIVLIDTKGMQVIRNRKVLPQLTPYPNKDILNRILKTRDGSLPVRKVGSLEYVSGRFATVSPTSWKILVTVPNQLVVTQMRNFHFSTMGLIMFTYLVVAILSALLSMLISLPIAKLGVVARAVSERNYKSEVVNQVPRLYDEVDRISSAFARMIESVNDYYRQLVRTQDTLTFGLTTIVEFRDPETGHHVERLAHYCRALAKAMMELESHLSIDEAFVEDIFKAAPLHDVGKVAIPDSILLKPSQLTPKEFEIMKRHTVIGAQAIEMLAGKLPQVDFLRMAKDIAVSHHEWWDGGGYPFGLRAEQIPLAGRILALADVYDALAFPRIYRSTVFPHEDIIKLIEEKSGSQFDPSVAKAFLLIQRTFEEIKNQLADPVKLS